MECYKLKEVWLCKLAGLTRGPEGRIEYVEYGPKFLLVECNRDGQTISSEVPEFRSTITGEEYFDGTCKGVYTPRDIGKTFVIEKRMLPVEVLKKEERDSSFISEERISQLYQDLLYSAMPC